MNEIQEEWRIIKGYEGTYEVSNFGRVRGLKRKVKRGNAGGSSYQKALILKPQHNPNGYVYVNLYTYNTNKMRSFAIHRLVANAFLKNPNPEVLTEVNHKDYDRTNNRVDNLEYLTHEANTRYSYKHRRKAPVVQLDDDGNVITFFYRQIDAREFGFNPSGISNVIRGVNKSHMGYHWRYATKEEIKNYIKTNKDNENTSEKDNKNEAN